LIIQLFETLKTITAIAKYFVWHGKHLPLGSDGLQSAVFFNDLAHEAGVIVMPMLFHGRDARKEVNGKELYRMDFWFDQSSMKTESKLLHLNGSAL
jgi:hypothetical protein